MYQPEKTRLISPSIGMSFPLSWAFLPGATDTTSMANIGPWTNQNERPEIFFVAAPVSGLSETFAEGENRSDQAQGVDHEEGL